MTGAPYCDRGAFRFFSGTVSPEPPLPNSASWTELAELGMAGESDAVYTKLAAMMEEAGGLGNLLRLHLFQHDKRQFPALESARLKFEGEHASPSSGIGVRAPGSRPWIEIDGIGLNPSGLERFGPRRTVAAGSAGRSASHYSQAALAGPYVFFAGMIPIDTATRKVVRGFDDVPEEARGLKRGRSHPDSRTGPIAAQTWSLYTRIFKALEELGGTAADLCSSTVFLAEAGDTADFLRVHKSFFPEGGPTLQLVCVDEVGHEGTLIEIECSATIGLPIKRWSAEGHEGRESPDVVVAGEIAYVGDSLGLTKEGVPAEGFLAQAEIALQELKLAVTGAGLKLSDVAHLWLRVARPCNRELLDELLKRHSEFNAVAVTITESQGLPHSERAEIAISAICAGVG